MGKIIYRKKSPYQEIVLERLDDGKLYLTLDDAYQFVSGIDEEVYHDVLARRPARMIQRPVRALILGGGDGLAARDLVKLPHVREVTLVELDPEMVRMSSTVPEMRKLNEDVFRSPKLRTVVGDARAFLNGEYPNLWNLVVVDFPDPVPEIEDLYSAPFYQKVVNHLDGLHGIVSVQASDTAKIRDQVARLVQNETRLPVRIASFSGVESQGGYVVYGGMGVL